MAGYRRKTRRTLVKNKTVEMNKNKKGFSRKKNRCDRDRNKNETAKSIGESRNESRNGNGCWNSPGPDGSSRLRTDSGSRKKKTCRDYKPCSKNDIHARGTSWLGSRSDKGNLFGRR
jgi:hypothetical protein